MFMLHGCVPWRVCCDLNEKEQRHLQTQLERDVPPDAGHIVVSLRNVHLHARPSVPVSPDLENTLQHMLMTCHSEPADGTVCCIHGQGQWHVLSSDASCESVQVVSTGTLLRFSLDLVVGLEEARRFFPNTTLTIRTTFEDVVTGSTH